MPASLSSGWWAQGRVGSRVGWHRLVSWSAQGHRLVRVDWHRGTVNAPRRRPSGVGSWAKTADRVGVPSPGFLELKMPDSSRLCMCVPLRWHVCMLIRHASVQKRDLSLACCAQAPTCRCSGLSITHAEIVILARACTPWSTATHIGMERRSLSPHQTIPHEPWPSTLCPLWPTRQQAMAAHQAMAAVHPLTYQPSDTHERWLRCGHHAQPISHSYQPPRSAHLCDVSVVSLLPLTVAVHNAAISSLLVA